MSSPGPAKRSPDNSLLAAYMEKRPNLVRYLAARTGSSAAAEDLAQDLFLKILALDRQETIESPIAFIYRMAANLVLDQARAEQRGALREAAWVATYIDKLGGQGVAREPAPDEVAAARQRLGQLLAAVADLPPQMQRAFRLHKLEGQSHAETARSMGVSAKAVEKHIGAALARLTRRLSQ